MSMAISRASYTGDRGYMGDPGFFGDIFGGIKGAIGGAVRGFMGRQPPVPTAGPGMYDFPMPPPSLAQGRLPVRKPGFRAFVEQALPFGASGMECPPMGDMSGYHLNKSSYFLMSGEFVPKGSRYVRNRKRNPANSRATSRAISRVAGAKTYAKSLGRISIRKKC